MSPNAHSSRTVCAPWDPQERMRQRSRRTEGLNRDWARLRCFGFRCALALIFVRFSFLSDFLTHVTGKVTYALYIFGLPALFAFLFAGGLRRTFRETGPKLWLAFVTWMYLGVPFSIWKGGAFILAVDYVKTVFILVLFTVGLTMKWTECRRIIYAIAVAAAFNVGIGLYFMRVGEERLSIDWLQNIGNSNDFAAYLLLVVPFLLFVVLRPSTHAFLRIVFLILVVLGLFEVLRAASRGALIALLVTVAFLFLRGSVRKRIAIGVTTAIAIVVLIQILPSSTWNRMLSFSRSAGAKEEALESSDVRQKLLEESIRSTFEHPVFGVGLGQFGNYEGAGPREPNKVKWRPPHNSYTQISSECGIPALIFYLAAVIRTFRLLSRLRKRACGPYKTEIITAAYVINIGAIAYCVAIFFVNFAYTFHFVALSALVEAMWRAVRDDSSSPRFVPGSQSLLV